MFNVLLTYSPALDFRGNKSMKKLLLVASIAAAIGGQNIALAQDNNASQDYEEVIVTGQLNRFGATKSALPILETARSISIESEEMFRDKGALTLDDTLNYVSGVVGDTFGFSTRGDFPRIRGFEAAEYRDGQQVLFGSYNTTRSDVYMLEQVEVLKGPASVLYGKGTPGGIVNAISKLAGPEKDNEIVLDIGTQDRLQLSGDVNFELAENLYGRVVGLVRDSGTQVDEIDDESLILMPSITYTNDSTSLTAMVEFVDRETDSAHQFLPLQSTGCLSNDVSASDVPANLTSLGPLCSNPAEQKSEASDYHGHPDFNQFESESTLVSLLGSHQFSENFSVDSVLRYKESDVTYKQAWVTFGGVSQRVDARGNGARTFFWSERGTDQLAADIRARWVIETSVLQHEIFAGMSYQNVKTFDDSRNETGLGVFNIFTRINGDIPVNFQTFQPTFFEEVITEEHGIYLNNQISIADLKINVGVRYDDVRSNSSGTSTQGGSSDYALSSSVGVLYAFDIGVSPYISYAESFEPVIGVDGLTNSAKKPREGEQIELGIKYQPAGTQTYITFAYFDIDESNLDSPTLDPTVTTQQEGVANSKGFELEAQSQFGDVGVEVNLSVVDTESSEGLVFDFQPEKQFSAWISYVPSGDSLRGFKSGLGVRYASENESNIVLPGFGTFNVTTDGATLFDAMLGYETESWDVTLNMRNIANEEYYGTCLVRGDCFPGEERTAVVRGVYKF